MSGWTGVHGDPWTRILLGFRASGGCWLRAMV